MDIVDVVMKLTGSIDPVGDSRIDAGRLANLKTLCELTQELLDRITSVAGSGNDYMASVKAAKNVAAAFLREADGAGARPLALFNIVDCGSGMRRLDWSDSAWWHPLSTGAHALHASTQPASPEQVRMPLPGALVIEALRAMDAEARKRGKMFPQTAEEQRESSLAVRNVIESLEFYTSARQSRHGWPTVEGWPALPIHTPDPL